MSNIVKDHLRSQMLGEEDPETIEQDVYCIYNNLSKDQVKFAEKAIKDEYEVDFFYSGRGMFGAFCPAVHIDDAAEWGYPGAQIDQMGLGHVIYKR